ncbi:hypothetical protein GTZ99_06390 [Novosphingobium sp. FSY-8]|uniref:Sulfite dehydrogenase (Cytochrome) subunit SorB n=1 Tax=Novosphingobium ovatum TaxID=1908523 RepID=A0ABW9XCC9_9SPHN|nr:cytochrome c [Novosphingobium ovatum]NBC36185.1 hypothetical protein [Novosphingobium ovatum]
MSAAKFIGAAVVMAGSTLCLAWTARAQAPTPANLAPADFVEAPGKAKVQAACTACHAAGIVTGKRHDAHKWGEVVDQMIDKGAQVPEADYDTIVAYLAKNYGPAQ